MKSFQEFIVESERVERLDSDEIIQTIASECRPFLDEIGFDGSADQLAFRGMEDGNIYIKNYVRKDRKPKDTSLTTHSLVDDAFNDVFGWRARSQSVMAFPSTGPAKLYGNAFAIFPIGEFRYLWSEIVKDMTMDLGKLFKVKLDSMNDEYAKEVEDVPYPQDLDFYSINSYFEKENSEIREIVYKYFDRSDLEKALRDIVKDYYIHNKGLKDWTKKYQYNEIMIECDYYYAVNTEAATTEDFLETLYDEKYRRE